MELHLDKPRTCFERIPEYFVNRYDDEICQWGANLRKIGPVKSIILREGVFAEMSPNPEMGPVLRQVKLRMEYSRENNTVRVFPDSDADEEKIRNHCQKMERLRVPARAVLTEPERAGIPFLPDRYS